MGKKIFSLTGSFVLLALAATGVQAQTATSTPTPSPTSTTVQSLPEAGISTPTILIGVFAVGLITLASLFIFVSS